MDNNHISDSVVTELNKKPQPLGDNEVQEMMSFLASMHQEMQAMSQEMRALKDEVVELRESLSEKEHLQAKEELLDIIESSKAMIEFASESKSNHEARIALSSASEMMQTLPEDEKERQELIDRAFGQGVSEAIKLLFTQELDKLHEGMQQVNKNVIKTNDNVVKAHEDVVKTNDNVVKTNDNVVKAHEDVVKTNDNVVKTNDNVVKTNEDVVKTNDNVVANNESIVSELHQFAKVVIPEINELANMLRHSHKLTVDAIDIGHQTHKKVLEDIQQNHGMHDTIKRVASKMPTRGGLY
jgi:uncharacterized phage infection (PIP) family protein YhgE